MAVSLDAVCTTNLYFSAPVTGGQTAAGNITVGSGSNRALLFLLSCISLGDLPTTFNLTWDPTGANQAFSTIFREDNGTVATVVFGLVNPTSGAKQVKLAYSSDGNSMGDTFLGGVSFNGVDQTGGATTFYAGAGANGTGTTVSQVIAALNGDAAVCGVGGGNSFTPANQNIIYLDSTHGSIISGAAQYALATGSVTFTWGGGATWHTAGCGIKAASVIPPSSGYTPRLARRRLFPGKRFTIYR